MTPDRGDGLPCRYVCILYTDIESKDDSRHGIISHRIHCPLSRLAVHERRFHPNTAHSLDNQIAIHVSSIGVCIASILPLAVLRILPALDATRQRSSNTDLLPVGRSDASREEEAALPLKDDEKSGDHRSGEF
ncbi:predicted protein [Plenodomus lingam JN3]|uniref:Predicted protein n=1 Tax=Leptosphaeria maculans (strain JN3 / isolate v23.1.3 / race Av1-4-5-6-7-8) TaxID=985895 RepID=E4ZRB4_LEPMJ|nr:predicted protein [Plenodomus lingam JN3]CBX93779.1 predicted protein [Plenodomus lingam JN3]